MKFLPNREAFWAFADAFAAQHAEDLWTCWTFIKLAGEVILIMTLLWLTYVLATLA